MVSYKFQHIYDTPEIYNELYNCNKGFKVNEGLAFSTIATRLKPDASTLLEVMAGVDVVHMQSFTDSFCTKGVA